MRNIGRAEEERYIRNKIFFGAIFIKKGCE